MSNYTKATNFAAKDALPSGNSAKRVLGTEIDAEFTAIQTSVNSKADTASPSFTGTITSAGEIAVNGGRVTIVESGVPMLELHDPGVVASALTCDGTELLRLHSTDGAGNLSTKVLGIDTAGAVSFPLQPAFFAWRGTSQTSGNVVVFSTEDYDIGADYNTGTGVFTAPATGIYLFTAGLNIYNTTGALEFPTFYIRHNAVTLRAEAKGEVANNTTWAGSVSAVIQLTSGDTVDVYFLSTLTGALTANLSAQPGTRALYFSGAKIA